MYAPTEKDINKIKKSQLYGNTPCRCCLLAVTLLSGVDKSVAATRELRAFLLSCSAEYNEIHIINI